MNKKNLLLILAISLIALLARLLPHTANFSPMASIILFAGVYATNKKYLLIPFIALFISDMFIGFYKWEIMLSVYLSLALIYLISALVKKNKNILNLASASLSSALLFFLVTNFAVWYFGDWYSKDVVGLISNYTMAIPFFKSTLMGNLFYSGLLFATYELSQVWRSKAIDQKS